MSDRGPAGATACWDWSQQALGGLWEECFFFQHSEGWWPAAESCSELREVSLGKKKKEKTLLPFLGSEWRGPVWVCVYVGEYKWASSHGTGAVPITSSWENTRGKIESQEKREREMKEVQILPFCSHWFITERCFVSQQFVRKRQQRPVSAAAMERDAVLTCRAAAGVPRWAGATPTDGWNTQVSWWKGHHIEIHSEHVDLCGFYIIIMCIIHFLSCSNSLG